MRMLTSLVVAAVALGARAPCSPTMRRHLREAQDRAAIEA